MQLPLIYQYVTPPLSVLFGLNCTFEVFYLCHFIDLMHISLEISFCITDKHGFKALRRKGGQFNDTVVLHLLRAPSLLKRVSAAWRDLVRIIVVGLKHYDDGYPVATISDGFI